MFTKDFCPEKHLLTKCRRSREPRPNIRQKIVKSVTNMDGPKVCENTPLSKTVCQKREDKACNHDYICFIKPTLPVRQIKYSVTF